MRNALRTIRAMGGRLLIVAALAIALTTGFVAVDHPSNASAMPKLSCADAYQVGLSWQVYGDLMAGHGYVQQAMWAYAKADSYFGMCDGGQF